MNEVESRAAGPLRLRGGAGGGPRAGGSGWSLAEIVVVLLLLGIAATILLGTGDRGERRLDVAAGEVAAALRFARQESLRTGDVYGVRIEPPERRVRVFRADTGTTPATPVYDVYDPVSKKLWDVDFDDFGPARGVTLTLSASWQGVCNWPEFVEFRSGGTPVCRDPLSVFLESADVELGFGDRSRTVTLHGFTGRVTATP